MIATAPTRGTGRAVVRRPGRRSLAALLAGLASAVAAACTDGTGPGISVSITPDAPSIRIGASQQLTATVTGSTNAEVSWAATCGAVVGEGSQATYTAPWEAGNCSVTATSVADPSETATASVTVTPVDPGLNLLPNGTFDTDIGSWSRLYHPTDPTALWNDEDARGAAGSGSAELYERYRGSGQMGNSVMTYRLPSEPGRRYTLIASARLLEIVSGVVPAIELSAGDANSMGLGEHEVAFASASADWTTHGVEFTTPPGTAYLWVEIGIIKPAGMEDIVTARFDDVILIEES